MIVYAYQAFQSRLDLAFFNDVFFFIWIISKLLSDLHVSRGVVSLNLWLEHHRKETPTLLRRPHSRVCDQLELFFLASIVHSASQSSDLLSLILEESQQLRPLLLVEAFFVFLARVLRVLASISIQLLNRVGHVEIAMHLHKSHIRVPLRIKVLNFSLLTTLWFSAGHMLVDQHQV